MSQKPDTPLRLVGWIIAFAVVGCVSAYMARSQPTQPSIEASMVEQTDQVLTILRVWHNQISQDQAVIKALQDQIAKVTKERDDLKAAAEPKADPPK